MPRGLTKKEAEIMESCYFPPRYSGEASVKFWKELSATKDRTLYAFACALQQMEQFLLVELNDDVRARARKLVMAQRVRKTRNRSRPPRAGGPA